jgi:hypothetical protein
LIYLLCLGCATRPSQVVKDAGDPAGTKLPPQAGVPGPAHQQPPVAAAQGTAPDAETPLALVPAGIPQTGSAPAHPSILRSTNLPDQGVSAFLVPYPDARLEDAATRMQHAENLFRVGRWSEALQACRGLGDSPALVELPAGYRTAVFLGTMAVLSNRPDQAIRFIRSALSNRHAADTTAAARWVLARAALSAGDSLNALEALRPAYREAARRGRLNTRFGLKLLEQLAALGEPGAAAELEVRHHLLRLPAGWVGGHVDPFETGFFDPFADDGEPDGLTTQESRCLRSFIEEFRYDFTRHSQPVRARTYRNRLVDTNILLSDLLNGRGADSGLTALAREFRAAGVRPDGAGAVFLDIGPGVANLATPAVTAFSLALDFPGMQVVALDLPDQVRIFQTQVAPARRRPLLDRRNFYILAGDGMHPLAHQLQLAAPAWLAGGKAPLGDGLLIVRAANSIDIYFRWEELVRVMRAWAADFAERPLLLLMNRAILFKPSGGTGYRLLGRLSPAGFDHNQDTLNRRGEAPYSLFPEPEAGLR